MQIFSELLILEMKVFISTNINACSDRSMKGSYGPVCIRQQMNGSSSSLQPHLDKLTLDNLLIPALVIGLVLIGHCSGFVPQTRYLLVRHLLLFLNYLYLCLLKLWRNLFLWLHTTLPLLSNTVKMVGDENTTDFSITLVWCRSFGHRLSPTALVHASYFWLTCKEHTRWHDIHTHTHTHTNRMLANIRPAVSHACLHTPADTHMRHTHTHRHTPESI